jgi:PAS domain S-box-containing protein
MLQQGLLVRDQQRVVAVARDGRRTLLHVNAALTHAPGGEVIGMIMVFRDLTGQAEAEALRQQEQERLRRVVEASPNGILLVDIQGQIALANRRAEELFGHSPGSLEGVNLAALVPQPAQAEHAQRMAGVFAQRQGRAMGVGRDVHGLRRDGTLVPLEIGLTPIEMPEGHFMLATLIDITERKQREDELRRSNADLEQFAYIASHDLQEPLRMVASYTELLAERYKGQLDERADKYIFYAVDGAKRMQRLVADLLAFARVGSQGKPLKPVDSGAVLAEVLRVLGPRLQAAAADVQADGMPTVMADEDQLFQLLQNLVGNALKFRSEAPPRIRISAVREGEAWRFAVADNGIGIEPQYQRTHLPDVPAPARTWPLRRQRHRPVHRQAHPGTPRRPHLAAVRPRAGQHLLLHAAGPGARSAGLKFRPGPGTRPASTAGCGCRWAWPRGRRSRRPAHVRGHRPSQRT